jgi:2-polyprenyl-3-methyl-5-hydroxy-6-metoxy-1,4-benzoquinol methylase
MNPFSTALLDYHAGDASSEFAIHRDDGFHQNVPASVFFTDDEFSPLETRALDLCNGHILDIGAAAGRHSLHLIRKGLHVTSLDILPEVGAILHDRGALRVVTSDILEFKGERFDTLLMLMNGIGMVGTLDRLDDFLRHAHEITSPSGQIICDSINVSVTSDPVHSAYRLRNISSGRHPGQQTFTISYGDATGDPFEWIHIDFETLSEHSARAGWRAELIESEPSGHYLCRLTKIHG